MAAKLRSVFRSPSSSLKFKALLFGVALFWVWAAEFSAASILFFVAAVFLSYLFPFFQGLRLIVSFISLVSLSLASAFFMPSSAFWFVIAFSSLLFYWLLAVKEYFFVNRQRWYAALNVLFMAWAAAMISFFSISAAMWLGIVYFFSLYEALHYLVSGERALLFSATAALLLYQLTWAIATLPVGFLSQAALITFFYYSAREMIAAHLRGQFSRLSALRWATVAIAACLLILISSKWSI